MYIQTTKQENELEKILIVNDIVPNRLKIGYDWKIIFENKFEDIEDFELFCISVANIQKTQMKKTQMKKMKKMKTQMKKILMGLILFIKD